LLRLGSVRHPALVGETNRVGRMKEQLAKIVFDGVRIADAKRGLQRRHGRVVRRNLGAGLRRPTRVLGMSSREPALSVRLGSPMSFYRLPIPVLGGSKQLLVPRLPPEHPGKPGRRRLLRRELLPDWRSKRCLQRTGVEAWDPVISPHPCERQARTPARRQQRTQALNPFIHLVGERCGLGGTSLMQETLLLSSVCTRLALRAALRPLHCLRHPLGGSHGLALLTGGMLTLLFLCAEKLSPE